MATVELTLQTPTGEESFELRDGKPIFVGRTVECDIHLPSPAVSRRHAVFLAKGDKCGLKDLGSSNGTFLNGKRLTKSARLKDGDVVQVGTFAITFRKAKRQAPVLDALKTDLAETAPQPAEPPLAAEPELAEHTDVLIEEPAATPTVEPAAAAPAAEEPRRDEPAPSEAPAPARGDESPEALLDAIDTDAAPPRPEEPPTRMKAFPIPTPPKAPTPVAEKLELDEDSIGDGDDDNAFVIDDDEEDAGPDPDLALAKKAAEAGLVGEFTPEVDGDAGGGGGGGGDAPIRGANLSSAPGMTDLPERPPDNPNAIPLSDEFRAAVETRLFLYSFLADMRREREEFIARKPKMADAVKAELARQDREIEKIPPPDKAEDMIAKRRAKQRDLMERIKTAKASGDAPPPKPSREMREAEEMAISQWTFCAQSAREALPAAFAEGFKLMRDEPLAEVLESANIDPVPLMGGGAYHLALETLLEETKYNRSYVRAKLANMTPPDEKKGGGKMFGIFGKKRDDDEDEDDAEEPTENYEELVENDALLADRAAWITQELASLEKALIQEFWKVYAEVALSCLPDHENMPFAARAFLRHGAIGFKPWWMPEAVRIHITDDCGDVIHHVEAARDNTAILYADEYLAAVMNWEVTPAMDENLEINERNSPNWKADKALRKLINARSQSTLMRELCETLDSRIDGVQKEVDNADQSLARLVRGQKNYKQLKTELAMRRQSFKVEMTKLTNLKNKIKNETLATLEETIAETTERFDSGELPRPERDFMIRRECEAVHKIGRLLANLKERFMPLVLRDSFAVNTDACNDRLSIRGEICEMERRDPAIFLETIIPSKKKANRVDLRISPVIVLVPSAGILTFSWNPRQRPEDGRLGIPTLFIRQRIRERQITYLLSDFRWDTSKAAAGMDVMTSETIVAAFMTVRWDWRKRSKEGREKGLIFTEQNDRTNWRRVYEAYSQSAYDAGKKLFNRNYDFYERIIGKYFDLPEGVQLLRK